jgi:hypothetical protein
VVKAYKINLAAMEPKTPASLQSRTYSSAYLEFDLLPFAIGRSGSLAFVAQVPHKDVASAKDPSGPLTTQ